MILASLVLFAAAQSADAPLEIRAEPIGRALPEIGRALGEPMRAAPVVAGELVIASIRERDPAAFRALFAKTFAGEWRVDSEGIWTFNRDEVARREEARAEEAKRVETIRKGMAKARAKAELDRTFDAGMAEALAKDVAKLNEVPRPKNGEFDAKYYGTVQKVTARGPGSRAMQRLFDLLPVELVAGKPGEGRVVYSTRPTAMQRPMPFDVGPVIRDWMREQNLWAETMGMQPGSNREQNVYYSELQYRKERVTQPPTVVTVAIKDQYGYRQVAFKAYDAKGTTLLDTQGNPGNSFDYEEYAERAKEKPKDLETAKVTLAPESKRFAELFDGDEARRAGRKFSPADYAPFLNVTARDPLSYGASDRMFAYARLKGKSLLVRPTDTLLYFSLGVPSEMEKEFSFAFFDGIFDKVEEGGWLALKAKDPAESRETFYDRKDLATALAIAAKPGRMDVARQARMALATPEGAERFPAYSLVRILMGTNRYGQDELLKLYGTLSDAEIVRAKSEAGLPIGALGERGREILRRFVYEGDEWQLQYNPTEEYRNRLGEKYNEEQNLVYGGYLREPTFAMPDGLSPKGTIHITADLSDKVKTGPITRRWGTSDGEVMDAEGLASEYFQKENPRRFPWMQDNEDWNKKNWEALTLVNQESVTMEIRFDERMTANATLTSDVAIEGGPYTLKTLPERFQKTFREAYARMEEQYKNQPYPDPNQYGRRASDPPPPPQP